MPLSRSLRYLGLATLLVAGCKDKPPKSAELSETMPNLPLPPLATVIGRSGGPDALQITFRSTLPPDQIATFYRETFNSGEWTLANDATSPDGTVSLYAERQGRPLWVTIMKDPNSSGTLLTVGGALIQKDSAASATGRT